MNRRHLTTAITMLVLCGILALALYVGFNSLFAPLPADEPAAAPSPSCTPTDVLKGERLKSTQVRVNVYNGGTRAGLAGATMDSLTRRGFRAGEIGNAPKNNRVRRAQVWIQPGEEAAGRLVARQFGPQVNVVLQDKDLADGVDVVVGNGYRALKPAKRFVVVRQPQDVCLPAEG